MIEFKTSIRDKQIDFELKGHAGFCALTNGMDVVCAMVSVLGQTAFVGCQEHSKSRDFKVKKLDEGVLSFTCRRTVATEAIVRSVVVGIKQVRLQFPLCFKDGEKKILWMD